VLVARSRAALARREGDAWDSGVVESERSTDVRYDGAPLSADETYHWTVRVRDRDGEWSAFGEAATFATAPDPARLDATWIGHQPAPGDSNGYRSRWLDPSADPEPWVQVDLGERRRVERVDLTPADPFDGPATPDGFEVTPLNSHEHFPEPPIRADGAAGFGFPVRYRVELADDPSFEDPTVVADRTDDPQPNPAAETVTVDAGGARGRHLRVTAVEPYTLRPAEPATGWAQYDHDRVPDEFADWCVFALAALSVRADGAADVARDRPVRASSSVESETWGRARLVDGVGAETASRSPLLRTTLALEKPVASARLHVSTLGWGETYVNGERVGEAVLDPGWYQYDRRVPVVTHEVGEHLHEGQNALGLWLGRGWFSKSMHSWTGHGSPRALCSLVVEYADGTTTRLASGPGWRAASSPVAENDVYDGERYDARREEPGWAAPGFDDGHWDDAVALDGPDGTLVPRRVDPAEVTEAVAPESVTDRGDEYVVDFGQNLAGWVELDLDGADPGQVVTLRHAEAVDDDGGLVTVDLRGADATDTYVARGDGEETYEPRFTYHGFRYAAVRNYPGEVTAADVTAKVVHTAMPETGAFECSDPTLERIQHAARWTQRSNSMSVPTDCPQRDERAGWGGDSANSGPAWMYNFDAVRFFEKWQRDHADEQSGLHGYAAASSPHMFGSKPSDPSWPLTRVVFPWYLYQHYGDRGFLAEQYEWIRRYVAFWDDRTVDDLLPREEGTYGDWLAFENTGSEIPNVGEPVEFFNNTSHYLQTHLLGEMAAVLGHDADAAHWRARAAAVRDAFNERFFEPAADRYAPDTQASYCLPLFLGLVPAGHEVAVRENLVARVEADGSLKTGFLSTRALLFALADAGRADLAYDVLTRPAPPSLGYMVEQGATTMWEHWDSDQQVGSGMNSLNHHQFSLVSEWLDEVLAGIRPGADAPGFAHVEVAPSVVPDLDWVRGAVETRRGEVVSRWERTDAGLRLDVTVPWNATATLTVPTPEGSLARVVADGETVWDRAAGVGERPAGVTDVAADGRTLELAAGTYRFDVAWD
jgi:alpha-L-rhamnosidase